MSKMIQVRNVPDDVHRELKVRAARAGMSLTDYVLRELAQVVARPPLDEVVARIRRRPAVELSETPAQAVRAERDSR